MYQDQVPPSSALFPGNEKLPAAQNGHSSAVGDGTIFGDQRMCQPFFVHVWLLPLQKALMRDKRLHLKSEGFA